MRKHSLLGLLAAAAITIGCAQTDAGITTKVKAKLAADDTVKAYQIDVDTKEKVVTLSGNVESAAAKDRAAELARQTTGVTNVVDNIVVAGGSAAMPGGGGAPAPGGEGDGAAGGNAPNPEPDRSVGQVVDDASITAAVKTKLLADSVIGGLKIDVDTREGVVYLTGDNLKSTADIDRAIALALEVPGVKSAKSKLVVGDKK